MPRKLAYRGDIEVGETHPVRLVFARHLRGELNEERRGRLWECAHFASSTDTLSRSSLSSRSAILRCPRSYAA